MPTYDYECPACSSQFEVRRSFNDNSEVKCPKCHKNAKKVFAPIPIIFKCSGFYVTDNGGKHAASRHDDGNGANESKVSKPADEAKAPAKDKKVTA